jgi:hypothetical protein
MHVYALPPDCKAFRALGLKATFYTDEVMLAAFPLLSHKAARSSSPPPVPGGRSLQAAAGRAAATLNMLWAQ